jgi:serine/arginine repetitive matrix protein 2
MRAVNEPQYDQVPIPGAYHAVHGEGIQVPSPYNVARGQQFLGHPGMSRQVSQASSHYSQQPSMHGRKPSGNPSMLSQPGTVGRQLSTTSALSHASAQPPPQNPQGGTAPMATPPPRSDKPLPDPTLSQRRESHTSNASMNAAGEQDDGPADSSAHQDERDRNPTPTPAPRLASRSHLGLDTAVAQRRLSDDMYEATPRVPLSPASDDSRSGAEPSSSSNPQDKTNGAPPPTATLTRGKSNRAELEDTEDERLRRLRRETQEEKILVGEASNSTGGAKKTGHGVDDVDTPMMSATSYPGQEWNPYASGAFDEDD